MPDLDSFRLPDLGPMPEHERLDSMVETVGLADRAGVLSILPRDATEVRREDALDTRIVTLRTRLHLLGYLRHDNGSPRVGRNLRSAVRRFQSEAGLTVDGWVGRETWTALEQLVDFETPAAMESWSGRPEAERAMWRAVRLRLTVLGLLDSRTVRSTDRLEGALARFSAAAWMLGVTPQRLPASLDGGTLRVLFDQDLIQARLAAAGAGFEIRLPHDLEPDDARELARRFIVCAATIELWLLGYPVMLDGSGTLRVPPSGPYLSAKFPLFNALERFWRSCGMGAGAARARSRGLDGSFFAELGKVEEEASDVELDSGRVYDEIARLKKTEQRSVWDHLQRIGSRLWDGMKRVWRWVRSLLRRIGAAVRAAVEWTTNLARLAYRYALTAFASVRRAVARTVSAVGFVLHRTLPGSNPDHLVIVRDRDLDLTLAVHPGRDPATVRAAAADVARHGRDFHAGVHVLARLVQWVIHTVATIAGTGGWFGLVLALVRVFRDLRRLAAVETPDLELLTSQ